MENKKHGNTLVNVVVALAVIFLLIKFGVPAASRKITGLDLPLPVPSTLFLFYAVLILIGTFVYVTSDEAYMESFLAPIKKLLRDGYGKRSRIVVTTLVPVVVAVGVFLWVRPTVTSPVALRIQHPSSNFPRKFESVLNPMENPTDAEIDEFIEQVKNNAVEFFPQVQEVGNKFTNIDFIPKKPVQDFLAKLKNGDVDRELAKEALHEKNLFEGRAMYEINCRVCHGDSAGGDGPMAYGFQLRPINFTDNGTIEVLVEGYTFWRVKIGGLGLPVESTPWDSAMPVWSLDLTEKERWAIIMGEYNLAQKTPRIREKLE